MPAVATVTPLEALLQRAGASDQDKPAWLAERRGGVTATEIRDLILGAITDRDLADLKLGRREENFAGNAYTAWGNEREPIIAHHLQLMFGIEPESRVFHAADDSRKLASPDGVGTAFDGELLVAEIKTAGDKYDIAPGSDDFEAKGYGLQVQWVLRVTGATRALYAWEPRLGRPGAFEHGDLQTEWIDRDDFVIDELDKRADRFLAVLDARALDPFEEPTVDEAIDTHAVNYLRFLAMEAEAGTAKKAEYDAILEAVGEREEFRQESTTARVTLTPMKVSTSVVRDEAAAREKAPALWESMVAATAAWNEHLAGFEREVPTETKPRVTITAIKPKGQKS